MRLGWQCHFFLAKFWLKVTLRQLSKSCNSSISWQRSTSWLKVVYGYQLLGLTNCLKVRIPPLHKDLSSGLPLVSSHLPDQHLLWHRRFVDYPPHPVMPDPLLRSQYLLCYCRPEGRWIPCWHHVSACSSQATNTHLCSSFFKKNFLWITPLETAPLETAPLNSPVPLDLPQIAS